MIGRLLLVASLLFTISEGNSQYVTLPNDAFKTFMRNNYASCFQFDPVTNDYLLDTTCIEMRNEDSLIVQNMGNFTSRVSLDPIRYYSSLKYLYTKSLYLNDCPPFPEGLEKLTFKSIKGSDLYGLPNGLRYLDCTQGDGITMSSVVKFPDSLRYLNCSGSPITVFPQISNTRLDTLICLLMYGSERLPTGTLRSLPALPATLKYLDCSQNALDSLPPLPDALEYLDCRSNFYRLTTGGAPYRTLTELPSLPPSLKMLDCSQNALTALPPLPNGLVKLICGYTNLGQHTGITTLPDLPSSLVYLECSQNSITALPILPDNLEYLNIAANDISTIARFPDSLRYFHANSNYALSSIPALPDRMTYLSVPLTNLTCLPHLPASLGGSSQYNSSASLNLVYSSNKIKCLPNLVNGIRTNQPLVLCTVTNNVNQCQTSPVVTGKVFYDIDGKGLKGPNEMYKSNVEFIMNNTLYTFSDDSGFYNISADTGLSVLKINSGSLFFSTPDSFQFNFSSFDTTVFLDLPLRSTLSVDSLRITLTQLNNARPGFAVHYKVKFENTGTTILSPVVSLDYDESLLAYDSSTNTGITNISGMLSFPPGNLYPGEAGTFISSFTLDPGASLGDSLTCLAKVSTFGFNDSARNTAVITSSYDPNDKNATPSLTSAAVVNGEYIDYLIRFQNTGTDTAFNVVITDTLSNFLIEETFEMITASHNCKVTRNNNALSFEFLNILLPDSNRNERLSHGFVNFKAKADPGVAPNTSISNFANIYFDYNAPVITNTAVTSIISPQACFTISTSTTNALCTQSNGSITVTVSGGTAPYSYALNNGTPQVSPDFTALPAGAYSVIVSDATGCVDSVNVTINSSGSVLVSTSSTPASCAGVNNGTITVTPNSGTAPYSYSLDGGASQTSETFAGVAAGPHTIVVTDAGGCTVSVTVTVFAGSGITATVSSTPSDCGVNNGAITVTASGGTTPYTYSLNGGAAQSSQTFSNVPSGTHTVTAQDATGCSASLTFVVDETPISGNMVVTQPTCTTQGVIDISGPTGTAPFQYSINGGTLQSAPLFNGLTAGTYVVLVQDANLCTYSETVVINGAPASVTPGVSITGSATSTCAGEPVTFTSTSTNGGANPQYQWSVNGAHAGTNSATLTINPATNVDVSVHLTSDDPCASPTTASSNVVSVTVNPLQTPSITISGNTLVNQGASTMIASTISNGGSTPAYQWQDSTANHGWINITGATSSTINYNPQQTGDALRCVLTVAGSCIQSGVIHSNELVFTVTANTLLTRVYPNPATSEVYVRFNPEAWTTAEVVDVVGRRLLGVNNTSNSDNVRIAVANLPSGTYYIKLTYQSGMVEHLPFVKL